MHGFYLFINEIYVYHKENVRVFSQINETTCCKWRAGGAPEIFSRWNREKFWT